MQINTSSKMYICIHATTITTGEKKTNKQHGLHQISHFINKFQSVN